SLLLDRIAQNDASARAELVELLTAEFQLRCAGKNYFPLSKLRETCRQLQKQNVTGADGLLAFNLAFADAAISVMSSWTIPSVRGQSVQHNQQRKNLDRIGVVARRPRSPLGFVFVFLLRGGLELERGRKFPRRPPQDRQRQRGPH